MRRLPFVPVLLIAAAAVVGPAGAAGDDAVWVGRFDQGFGPWREVRLKAELKPNEYGLRDWDGRAALEVRSSASMSLMARPLAIDLEKTPVLCWRWRIDAPLQRADMSRRAGDDYAARLYVSLRIPEAEQSLGLRAQLRFARAIWGPEVPDAAINYVWDGSLPVGTERPNAYTERTTMIVLRSGAAQAGRWVQERRDLRADVRRLRGAGAWPVQLAVTADTDNTGESARAGFADLHLVPQGSPCRDASPL